MRERERESEREREKEEKRERKRGQCNGANKKGLSDFRKAFSCRERQFADGSSKKLECFMDQK